MLLEQTILIADEQSFCREGLAALLNRALSGGTIEQTDRFAGVITALSSSEAITMVILDLGLPGLDGIAGIRRVRSHFPNARIVVTAASLSRDSIVECLRAGVHGCIAKSTSSTEVVEAFNAIGNGRIYVPSLMSGEVEEEHSRGLPKLLSGRQREVLEELAAGRSNKEIARKLGIAEGTVKVHVNAVFRTLGVRNRVGAAAALRQMDASSAAWEPALPGLLAPFPQEATDDPLYRTGTKSVRLPTRLRVL